MKIMFNHTGKMTVELTRKQARTIIEEIDDRITELRQIKSKLAHELGKETE